VCGIAGIFAYRDAAPAVDETELRAIRDAMAARGPDAFGAWIEADARLGLAHRRLSILDLSERGAQPMASEDGSRVVVFNGEIYNHAELRADLESRGFRFRSTSDTEVLLALYAADGEAMLPKLRGMYAFALWDARRRGLFLARDPYGIKPLYLADDGQTLRFASQTKALLAGRVGEATDAAGLAGFLLFGSVPEPFTKYRAIRSLEAGTSQWFDERGPSVPKRHGSVAATFARAAEHKASCATEAELRREVAAALADSVRHHLVADVPVGAFLSAGVDSTTLVSLMRDAGSEDVRTVTLAFDDLRGTPQDEAPLAESMARRYETRHTTVRYGASALLDATDAFLTAMDQPSIDGLNQFLVSRAAHDAGLKVALSGLGADELFGGYPSFRTLPRWVSLLRGPSRLPAVGRALESAFHHLGGGCLPVTPKLASLVRYGGSYPGAYLLRRGLFMPAELPGLLGREVAEEGLGRLDPIGLLEGALTPDPLEPYARVAVLESSLYMRNQLLRDSDWASMAHGLEVRVPFVDATLTERLAPWLVANGARVRGKELIAGAPKVPIPAALVDRPKTGFFVPVAPLLADARTGLDTWRRVPTLAAAHTHWSRRMAYALVHRS
jgi:asparagine synthase (glutamine-hydrolysing)